MKQPWWLPAIRQTRLGAALIAALVVLVFSAGPLYFSIDYANQQRAQASTEAQRHLKGRMSHAEKLLERAKTIPGIVALTISQSRDSTRFEERIRNLLSMSGIVQSVEIVPPGGQATVIERDKEDQVSVVDGRIYSAGTLKIHDRPFLAFGNGSLLIRDALSEYNAKGDERFWGFLTAEASFAHLIQELQLTRLVGDGFGAKLYVQWPSDAKETVIFNGGDVPDDHGFSQSIVLPGSALLTLTVAPPAVGFVQVQYPALAGMALAGVLLFLLTYQLLRRPQLLAHQVEERTREIAGLNRVLLVLGEINHLIIRTTDSEILLREACRILEEKGGFPFAWAHFRQDGRSMFFADEKMRGYAERITAEIENTQRRCWPERSLRCYSLKCCNRNLSQELDGLGLKSLIHLPLRSGEMVWGDIGILGATDQTFGEDEYSLLEELAGNLSFALDTIYKEAMRRAAENKLELSARVFENSSEGIIITDANSRILMVNRAFSTVTGYTAGEAMGQTPSMLNSGRHPPAFFNEMWAILQRDGEWRGEIINRRKNGEEFPEWLTITQVRDEQNVLTNFVAVFSDLSSRRKIEARLDFLVNHDPLTALPNRTHFTDRLATVLAEADRAKQRVALIYFDLDRFKLVNESVGPVAGDQLLVEVAKRITAESKDKLDVARLGGDQFAVILPGLEGGSQVMHLVQSVQRRLGESFDLDTDHPIHLTTSIGISMFPEDGADPETLASNAESAMYEAIKDGGNTYRFFRQEMNEHAARRLHYESRMFHALENGELAVNFQPFVATTDGRIAGAETLLRWSCAEFGGSVSPVLFIPILEEIGLIREVGSWVLDQACAAVSRWRKVAGDNIFVAVNISALQLTTDLVSLVSEAICRHNILPAQLEIELTESAIMNDVEQGIRILHQLRALGVKLSVDDFGTGYSSLSYLKRLPVTTLKIDRSFISDTPYDVEATSITQAILAMGNSLHLTIIAEGVETADQVSFLCQRGCDLLQGYYFSKPLPANEFARLLESTSSFNLPAVNRRPLQLATTAQQRA